MVLFFFLGLIFFASIIAYNEVIEGKVTITSQNPPVHLRVRQTGTISKVNYGIGDSIPVGAIVGILKNQADEKDVAFLKDKLQPKIPAVESMESLLNEFPFQLRLGSTIQPFYKKYLESYQKSLLNKSLEDDVIMQEQVLNELSDQELLIMNKKEELDWSVRNLNLFKNDYQRHEELYRKGIISSKELEEVEKEFLREQRQYELSEQEYVELISKRKYLQKKDLLTKNAKFRGDRMQNAELALAQQDLINAISQWEEEYVFRSPISGRISYLNVLGENQNVNAGDIISTIVPLDQQNLIGKSLVPVRNSGKLRRGQKVILKLENFPFREWGTLNATVETISEIPQQENETGFLVYFKIDSLTTSHGRILEFNQDLIGTAEIIVDEVSILERIFYQLLFTEKPSRRGGFFSTSISFLEGFSVNSNWIISCVGFVCVFSISFKMATTVFIRAFIPFSRVERFDPRLSKRVNLLASKKSSMIWRVSLCCVPNCREYFFNSSAVFALNLMVTNGSLFFTYHLFFKR